MPNNLEIERKYLIEIPDMNILQSQKNYTSSRIEQMYLHSDNSSDYKGDRIRKRSFGGNTKYYKTHKEFLTGFTKLEIEEEISADEYQSLSKRKLEKSRIISKVRHCFDYKGQLFELDIYDFWDDKASIEAELESEEQQVELPEFIKVIRDVTSDRSFSNYALSIMKQEV